MIVELNKNTMEKAIVINDIHIPHEDKKVLSKVLDFIEEWKPDVIFLNGDVMDCASISKFPVRPDEYRSLKEEVLATRAFFERIRGPWEIYWIFGNHEARLEKYILDRAEELFGFVTLDKLTQAEQHGVKIVNSGLKESFMLYGDILIGHFNKVSKHSAYTAKALADDKGVSLIQGHTHRVGTHIRRKADCSYITAYENGCLCQLNPSYTLFPNWCHGFSLLYKQGKHVTVQQIPIINGDLTLLQ